MALALTSCGATGEQPASRPRTRTEASNRVLCSPPAEQRTAEDTLRFRHHPEDLAGTLRVFVSRSSRQHLPSRARRQIRSTLEQGNAVAKSLRLRPLGRPVFARAKRIALVSSFALVGVPTTKGALCLVVLPVWSYVQCFSSLYRQLWWEEAKVKCGSHAVLAVSGVVSNSVKRVDLNVRGALRPATVGYNGFLYVRYGSSPSLHDVKGVRLHFANGMNQFVGFR